MEEPNAVHGALWIILVIEREAAWANYKMVL